MRQAISLTLDSLVSLSIPADQIAPPVAGRIPGMRRTTLLYIVRMIVYFYFIMLSTHWGHIALLPAAWSKLIGNVLVRLGGSHVIVAQSQVSDNMHYDRLLLCFVITLIFFDRDVARIWLTMGCIEWKRRLTALDGVSASFVMKNFSSRAMMTRHRERPLVIEVRNNFSLDLDSNYTKLLIVASNRAIT